jgi:hypothetical protein
MSEGEIQGKEQNKLTEQNKSLKDLVFQSFRFSQGDLMTQSHMLQWLRRNSRLHSGVGNPSQT